MRTLYFAGLAWIVKDGHGGPGPNHWSSDNVFVDDLGRLHLRIARRSGRWTCAEVRTAAPMGLGRYRFKVEAAIDKLDPWIVLGLFSYPSLYVGADGTQEVDIEFARWGRPRGPFVHFSAWPTRLGMPARTRAFAEPLYGTHTTHIFERLPSRVAFRSFHGHLDGHETPFRNGEFVVTEPAYVSHALLPLHVGLWLFQGHPPANEQEVEVVITDVTHTPLEATADDAPVLTIR